MRRSTTSIASVVGAVLLAGATLAPAAPAHADPADRVMAGSTRVETAITASPDAGERVTYDGPEGERDYVVVAPEAGAAGAPVLVALHGCSQDADDVIAGWRLDELSARTGALIVAPEQPTSANTLSCWNWFLPEHQERDAGEPALLTALVDEVVAAHGADASRVVVAGLSAGGAMAIVLGVTYPDRFALVGSVAGCPYRGLPCLGAPSLTPDLVAGRLAFEAMGDHARAVPLVVVQGEEDGTVPPQNADRITGQWLAMADLVDDGEPNGSVATDPVASEEVAATDERRAATVRTYDLGGCAQLERWDVEGLDHAWPGGDPDRGTYADALGPDATTLLWDAAVATFARCGDESGASDGGTGEGTDDGADDGTGEGEVSPPPGTDDGTGDGDEEVAQPTTGGPAAPAPATRALPATGAGPLSALGVLLLLAATALRRPRGDGPPRGDRPGRPEGADDELA